MNESLNDTKNNICNVINNNKEENDNDYHKLKIVINKKFNKIKTATIHNNNQNNDENFIEEKTKKLDSYFVNTNNITTESILDKNNINDKTVINYKNEEKSDNLNTTIDNMSCCSENFLNIINNNDKRNSPINNNNNNEEIINNIKNSCNTTKIKSTTTTLPPLLSAIFSNTTKNFNINANINNNNNTILKIQQMFEAQNKFYSTLILEQQRKNMSAITSNKLLPLLNINNKEQKIIENTLLPQTQLHQFDPIDKIQNKKVVFIYSLVILLKNL